MQINIKVTKQGDMFLGECLQYPVMTHGRNLDELETNMTKALDIYLASPEEDEEDNVMVMSAPYNREIKERPALCTKCGECIPRC